MSKILLERHKMSDYVVNYEGKRYEWSGAKNGIVGKKEVPIDVYDWLSMFTSCFVRGELVVKPKTEEEKEELLENMNGKEQYEVNALTKEQAVDLLSGNLNKMKKELGKVDSQTTKQFVLNVAREIGVENANKRLFIKEWCGSQLSTDELFAK